MYRNEQRASLFISAKSLAFLRVRVYYNTMEKAFKVLRIISCVIAAACAAACVPMFIWFESPFWGLITVLVGVIFFVLMILFKHLQENAEIEDKPETPRGDFITGPVKSDDPSKPQTNDANEVKSDNESIDKTDGE